MCRNADIPDSLPAEVVNAIITVRAYRENHRIEPVPAVLVHGKGVVCDHDGIVVHPIRNGFRHDMTRVAELSKMAGALG